MGPNPWTDDPVTECRSMGLTPGSSSFNECMLLSKEMQLGRNDPGAATSQKPSGEAEALAAQKYQSRSCNMSTGVCAPALLKQ